MGKNRYILLFAITSLLGSVSYAQQDPQLTLFMFNDVFYNPAFAGSEGVTKVTLLDRHQWIGYQPTFDDGVAPTTQVLSMTAPIYRILPGASGFGLNVVNDQLGNQNNLQINGSFAYHIGIKKTKLSLGLRIGMFSQSFGGNWRPLQEENLPGRESQVRPDMAFGAFFRAEKYYAGISFNHLLKAEFDFGIDTLSNAIQPHAVITGGYVHKVNFDITLRPSVLIMTDFNQYTFTIGGIVEYKEKIDVGLSFRQSEDINLILGYNFLKDKSLGVHYSFGYVYKDQEAKQPTSHELMIGYRLPVSPGGGKKIVRTPRFRH